MTAVPALTPLRIMPIPRPRLEPAPLPGLVFPNEDRDDRFIQDLLDFGAVPADDAPGRIADLPDPADIITPLATALAEVLAGRRPVVQLVRWTSPAVYAALAARAAVAYRRRLSRPGGPVRIVVRRVVLTQPREQVAEAAIVVIDGIRVRAIALQLRGESGRWSIEALQVG